MTGPVALLVVAAALLTGCSDDATGAAGATDPDTADCTAGSYTVSRLQSTFRGLSDQLSGVGSASADGDIAAVRQRITEGIGSADHIRTEIDTAAGRMTAPGTGRAYRDVAVAAGQVRDSLTQMGAAVDGARPIDGVAAEVSTALDGLDGSVRQLRLSCSSIFAQSIPDRTAPAHVPNS